MSWITIKEMINMIKILSGDTTHWSVILAFFPNLLLLLYWPAIWLIKTSKKRIRTVISNAEYAQTCTPPKASWVKISTKIIPEKTILSRALLIIYFIKSFTLFILCAPQVPPQVPPFPQFPCQINISNYFGQQRDFLLIIGYSYFILNIMTIMTI